MRLFITFICTSLLSACVSECDGLPAHVYVKEMCVEYAPTIQTCMIDCAKVANPIMSGEEGEDLVRQCALECRRFNCARKELQYTAQISYEPCLFAEIPRAVEACEKAEKKREAFKLKQKKVE